jgi:hypothetical protein
MWEQEVDSDISVQVHFTETEMRQIKFARSDGYEGFHPVSLEAFIRFCIGREMSRIQASCGEAIKYQWGQVYIGKELPKSRAEWEQINPDFLKPPKDYFFSKPTHPFHKPGPFNN